MKQLVAIQIIIALCGLANEKVYPFNMAFLWQQRIIRS